MKSKIAILAVTLVCLAQGADSVRAQQPYPGGGYPSPARAAMPGYTMPGQPGPGYPMPGQPMPGYAMPGQPGPGYAMPGQLPAGYPTPGYAGPGYGQVAPVRYAPPQPMAGGQYAPQAMQARVAPMPMMALPTAAYSAAAAPALQAPGYSGAPAVPHAAAMDIQPMPAGTGAVQGEYTAGGSGSSCDDCDDCGGSECGGECEGHFGGLFGSRCGSWLRNGHLKSGLHSYFTSPRPARIWGSVEGLWWWNKDRSLPILATTSVPGTPLNQAGVLGEPGTSVLFGGGEFDGDASEGARITLGFWFDRDQTVGIFARVFQFGSEDIGYQASSTGDPILARPFYDVGLGIEDSLVVAYPGISRGRINIQTSNEARGYDLLLRKMLYYGDCNRIDLIGGYHNTELSDGVQIQHEIISVDPQGRVPVGTRINTSDSFVADNQFNGGSIGLMAQGFDGRLTWNFMSKISFGNNRERVSIRGTSTTSIPGFGSATFDQGLLALDTNSGIYEDNKFAFVPELDMSVMYSLTSMLSVSVGYSFIYWSDIAVAGPAVDTVINPTQIDGPIIGPARPTYALVDDDFWLHGLTFGVHGRF